MSERLSAATEARVANAPSLPSGKAILTTFGWGCFLALQTYFGLCYALPLAESYSFDVSILLRTGAVIALIAALAVCSGRANWIFERLDKVIAPAALIGCIPFAYEAAHIVLDLSLPEPLVMVLSVIAWMCLGVSFLMLGMVWCAILSQNTFKQGVSIAAVGAAVSVAIYFTTSCIHPPFLSLVASAFVITCSYGCAYVLIRYERPVLVGSGKEQSTGGELAETNSVGKEDAEAAKPSSQEILWHTTYNAVYAYMLLISATQGTMAVIVVGSCGIIGAALAMFADFASCKFFPESRQVYQLSLPFVVVMFLILPYCEGSWGVIMCAGITVVFNSYATILYWAESTSHNAEFGMHPVKRFAEYSYPKWLGMLLGSVCGYLACATNVFEGEATYIVSIFVAGLLLMSFMAFSLHKEKEERMMDSRLTEVQTLEVAQSDDVESACKLVAEQGGLSPRESEVLVLLAKGRNARYIQENLFISLSTARSHIYHIYQKLGVSSQQGLIDLVEAKR